MGESLLRPSLYPLIMWTTLTDEALRLLSELIRRPSVSREEGAVADYLEAYLREQGAAPRRLGHNVWCEQEATPSDARPVLLLNAHIDTVRPVSGWQRNPFEPVSEDGRLYGLGSNDCGGGLVCLLLTFLSLRRERLPYRLVFLASAEEEVSGRGGIEAVLPELPEVAVAIVGEPTAMQPAIAEKGLMVLDCVARGKAGHAARDEGVNAIYRALDDVAWFRSYVFPKVSPLLGPVKMSVTQIEAGTQHNVVPDACKFVVDVRSNECYTNAELLAAIEGQVGSEVRARSTRLSSSRIDERHPLVQRAVALGGCAFGSPTLSDQALMPFPSFKYGPGHSSRSHTADEYIERAELSDALAKYHAVITGRGVGEG